MPRSRLRASDLERTFHGARAVIEGATPAAGTDAGEVAASRHPYPRTPEVARIHERACQYTAVMAPAAFFSHVTSAVLWDAPLPNWIFRANDDDEATFDPEELDVSVLWPGRAPRGRGIRGHAVRPAMATARVHPVSGLRVASPATTWAMLAGLLPHPYDLVAVADHFARIPRPPHGLGQVVAEPPLATIEQLTRAVEAGRRTGAGQLRTALARVRTGSSSRTETWTRLTVIDAGLPEPVLDYDVIDELGRFLACVDMAYPQWRIAIEYEGVHHSSSDQWESDVDRYAALEAAGWRIIRVTKRMLFQHPDVLIRRVREAIAARAG